MVAGFKKDNGIDLKDKMAAQRLKETAENENRVLEWPRLI